MSGSSLDGLDLAVCTFELQSGSDRPVACWTIDAATTLAYTPDWQDRLRAATELPAAAFWQLHGELGDLIGRQAARFLRQSSQRPTLVGCHGHTVFHEPASGYSVQLGEGSRIAAHLDLPVVTELRAADIAAGGQGAPLAPVADRHLFPDHRAFLNLGGIANFSIRTAAGDIVAGDVSGCCQILDRLAALAGNSYDDGGRMARSGTFVPALARRIEALDYHHAAYPKSLSNDWVVNELWPLLADNSIAVEDRMHTFCGWLAGKIAADMSALLKGSGGGAGAVPVLVTGGGAHHTFLVDSLNAASPLPFASGYRSLG